MKMSLTEIDTLIAQSNTIVSKMPTSEGQVTRIVFGKNFQGLHIPEFSWGGPVNISCGKMPLYVVKTGEKMYEIHRSKTAYLKYKK
jgi:hypothetical protein